MSYFLIAVVWFVCNLSAEQAVCIVVMTKQKEIRPPFLDSAPLIFQTRIADLNPAEKMKLASLTKA